MTHHSGPANSGMHVTWKGFALAASRLKLISLVWRDLFCLRIGYIVAFIVIKKSSPWKIASEVKTVR
jgi:orotate phosphoribosyltransferase-like protein